MLVLVLVNLFVFCIKQKFSFPVLIIDQLLGIHTLSDTPSIVRFDVCVLAAVYVFSPVESSCNMHQSVALWTMSRIQIEREAAACCCCSE